MPEVSLKGTILEFKIYSQWQFLKDYSLSMYCILGWIGFNSTTASKSASSCPVCPHMYCRFSTPHFRLRYCFFFSLLDIRTSYTKPLVANSINVFLNQNRSDFFTCLFRPNSYYLQLSSKNFPLITSTSRILPGDPLLLVSVMEPPKDNNSLFCQTISF